MKVFQIKSPDGLVTKLLVSSKCDTRFFNLSEIIYCSAERNYTRIHLINGNSCLSYVSLSKVADILNVFGFLMVHKSFLVNAIHILGFSSGERYNLKLTNEVEITINYEEGYSYQGPKEGIMSYLEMGFNFAPDSRISEVKISEIKIHQNNATVQIGYIVSSKSFNFSISIDEYMDLLKENNEWKIRRINIEY